MEAVEGWIVQNVPCRKHWGEIGTAGSVWNEGCGGDRIGMAGEDGLDRRGGDGLDRRGAVWQAGTGSARYGRKGKAVRGTASLGGQGMAWRGKEEQKQGG